MSYYDLRKIFLCPNDKFNVNVF